MRLGINLSFAVKRMPEGRAWARFVREALGLDLVQFTFDLIDPWTPAGLRQRMAEDTRRAAAEYGITIHSTATGLAAYTYNSLLHPDEAARQAARMWWENAIALTAALDSPGIGGQLGALSVADAANPAIASARYDEAFHAWIDIAERAAQAGLQTLYIEPTPLTREFPHTIAQCIEMYDLWQGKTALPTRYAFDIGHAGYRPLYGGEAPIEPWLSALGDRIGLLHVQNTDGMSDSHWGWPDGRGTFDVAAFGAQVRAHGLDDLPVFIEVFYPFELSDAQVLDNIRTSVEHCKRALDIA